MAYLYGVFKNHALEKVFDGEDAAVEYAKMRIVQEEVLEMLSWGETVHDVRRQYRIFRIAEFPRPEYEVLIPGNE